MSAQGRIRMELVEDKPPELPTANPTASLRSLLRLDSPSSKEMLRKHFQKRGVDLDIQRLDPLVVVERVFVRALDLQNPMESGIWPSRSR